MSQQGFGERTSTPVTGTFAVADAPVQPPAGLAASYTTAVLASARPTFGSDHRLVVRVSGPGTPTGAVSVSTGTRDLGTATLADGRAVVTVPGAALPPGQHRLTVSYAGDAGHRASADVVAVEVGKASATLRVDAKQAVVGRRQRHRLVVDLGAGTTITGGTLRVVEGNRVVKVVSAKDGRRRIVLPKLRPGKHRLVVGLHRLEHRRSRGRSHRGAGRQALTRCPWHSRPVGSRPAGLLHV